jgi:YgiT-type zinc finger domain-containing protein
MPAENECAHCGFESPQLKQVQRSFGAGSTLLVIEHIPMWSCANCGESYFTAKTLHEVERIKTLRKALAVKKSVAVAVFEPLAA